MLRHEPFNGVALLALIEPGRGSELGLVIVAVAVEAAAELHFEDGVLPLGM